MAIAIHGSVVTDTEVTAVLPVSPCDTAVTIAAGTDLCLFTAAIVDASTDENPTQTWDGGAMTAVGEVIGSSTSQPDAVFKQVNPNLGTLNLRTTWDVDGGGNILGVVAVCLSGVNQTTPNDAATAVDAGGVTSISSDISSETGDLVIDFVGVNGDPTITAGAGQTERANFLVQQDGQPASGGTKVGCSTEPGGATVTMSWSWSASSSRTSRVVFNINAASVAQPGPSTYANRRTPSTHLLEPEDEGRFNELNVRSWW